MQRDRLGVALQVLEGVGKVGDRGEVARRDVERALVAAGRRGRMAGGAQRDAERVPRLVAARCLGDGLLGERDGLVVAPRGDRRLDLLEA